MTADGPDFQGILCRSRPAPDADPEPAEPAFFRDLRLDQVVAAVTAGKSEYALEPLFYTPLVDIEDVRYRQEVMADLSSGALDTPLARFAGRMRTVREHIGFTEKRLYDRERERWILDAADRYREAVEDLAGELSHLPVQSAGLTAFRDWLSAYASSPWFAAFAEDARRLTADLASLRYVLLIQGLRVEVQPYQEQADYGKEIESLFERFRQGSVRANDFAFTRWPEMNSVEARIAEELARMRPDLFARLDRFCETYADFVERRIAAFDREIQFYVSFREFAAKLEGQGLSFCTPSVTVESKAVHALDCFDLALAAKSAEEGKRPVVNDFKLEGSERMIVVTGPNQGGKTTFACMFGQAHYIASLGLPVPGREAALFLPDRIFTHFERAERLVDLSGRLRDDLDRIHAVLTAATPRSIVIVNEMFASTTLADAVFLSTRIGSRLSELDLLSVWVTFIDELASLNAKTVSMVSTVLPSDPTVRTFKIVRKPADGLAYAMLLAERRGLTRERIEARIKS